jgi:hypothetical protein
MSNLDYFTQMWIGSEVRPVLKTKDVGLVASRDFSKEEILNLKACYTKCSCHHFAPNGNDVCTYRNCRHGSSKHYGWNRIRLVNERCV